MPPPPTKIASEPQVEERLEGLQPTAVLSLGSHVRMHFDARKGRMHEQTQHRAALAFEYRVSAPSANRPRTLQAPEPNP